MASITTRSGKGSPLTHAEVDANFTNLNTDKAETAAPTFTGQVKVAAGTAAAPGVAVTGDLDTGIYSAGVNQLAISTGGTERLRIDATGQIEAVSLGTAAAPTYTFTGDPNTGLYSPGADQVAISTAGTGRLFVDASGNVSIGASSTPSSRFGVISSASSIFDIYRTATGEARLTFWNNNASSTATICSRVAGLLTDATAGSEQGALVFQTATSGSPTEKVRITSAGNVGIGTSSPSTFGARLAVIGGSVHADRTIGGGAAQVQFSMGASSGANFGQIGNTGTRWSLGYGATANTIGTEVLVWNSSGNVGIGTPSPNRTLTVSSTQDAPIRAISTIAGSYIQFTDSTNDSYLGTNNGSLVFFNPSIERARIDSSGRLLVGAATSADVGGASAIAQFTSTGTAPHTLSLVRANEPILAMGRTGALINGSGLGVILFCGDDGTDLNSIGASITAQVDGTHGVNDMPGRLVFSTTSDGAASPTERMRITQSGFVNIGNLGTDIIWNQTTVNGVAIQTAGSVQIARNGDACLLINRNGNDGNLVNFAQAGVEEGTISVSGSTVSYNGAHLSRWSQLPFGAERTEILRGSVLSNIDEMCEWGDEDNEQLNRMKVSDVEGDKNVSGVFQAWDDDDDTYTNDFYCAMTGDFIIRIAEGVMVERGDLLMSAGDGTAKPQDDDIIRSKTIAKVTSTNVTCTYEDGSYCVPCVLMAC